MELGESVAVGGLLKEMKEKCPFKEPAVVKGSEENDEDDEILPGDEPEQKNKSSILGQNLAKGKPEPSFDVTVLGDGVIATGGYSVKCAAHHLIPGNASLGRSDLYDFLGPAGSGELTNKSRKPRKRKNVWAWKREYPINAYIGYNINGSHNGVWLPGNYAIRASGGTTPIAGQNWSELEQKHAAWQLHYVAAASRAASAQFHDTHQNYNERVLKLMNKITGALRAHMRSEGGCDCSAESTLPPPFTLKRRLYAISLFLRGELSREFAGRRPRWYTSDRWAEAVFKSSETSERYTAVRQAAWE